MGHQVFKKIVSGVTLSTFLFTTLVDPTYSYAQTNALPAVGSALSTTADFTPVIVRGLSVYPENPMKFDFIVDAGTRQDFTEEKIRHESDKLIKYFLAALTIPDKDQWVNLSPYEQHRIVEEDFGKTQMGRDLLAQDYILKQLMASLSNPDDKLGQEFWDRVYSKAAEQYGSADIPLDTFNKVWIMPDKASVYETGNHVFVVDKHLKVMLEEDYLAMQNSHDHVVAGERSDEAIFDKNGTASSRKAALAMTETKEIIKEILLPELEREVNEGEHFAVLRQVYNAMILATWFKMHLKESILGQAYADHKVTAGVDDVQREDIESIYRQYLEAYKVGVYDLIKEDYDPVAQQIIPKKYFSGGFNRVTTGISPAMLKIFTPQDGTVDLAQLVGLKNEIIVTFSLKANAAMLNKKFWMAALTVFALMFFPVRQIDQQNFVHPVNSSSTVEHRNIIESPSDLKINQEFFYYSDAYNSPPQWETYDYSLPNPMDVSSHKTMVIDLRSIGQRNVFVEMIDVSRLKWHGQQEYKANFDPDLREKFSQQRAFSRVYSVGPDDDFLAVDLQDFNNENIDLKNVVSLRFYTGDHFFSVRLNRNPGWISVKGVRFSQSSPRPNESSVDFETFKMNSINEEIDIKKQLDEMISAGANLPAGVLTQEQQDVHSRDLNTRIETVKNLTELAKSGDQHALDLLQFELINPEQNLNLRRYIYFAIDQVLVEPIDTRFLDDSVLRSYWVTDPFVVEMPSLEDVRDNVVSEQKKNPRKVSRILDRRTMERLAYWSLIMKIDPVKVTFPSLYLETRLGDHPDKTYNIMAIHVPDLEQALPPQASSLRESLLKTFGEESPNEKLDRIIVTGLILMQDGFNTFFDSNEFDLRLQGYNGYGNYPWDPFKGRKMSEFPAIGRMVQDIGERLPDVFKEIVQGVSQETGLNVPNLPKDLKGFRIGIGADAIDSVKKNIKHAPKIRVDETLKISVQDLIKDIDGKIKVGQNFVTSDSVEYRKDGSRLFGTAARWQSAVIHLGGIDLSNGQSLVLELNLRKGSRVVIQIIDDRQKHGEEGNDYTASINGSGRLQVDYEKFNDPEGKTKVNWAHVKDIVIHYGAQYFDNDLNRFEDDLFLDHVSHVADKSEKILQDLWWTTQDMKNYMWRLIGIAVSLLVAWRVYRKDKKDDIRIKPQRQQQGKTLVHAKFKAQVLFLTLASLAWSLASSATELYDFLIAGITFPILYNLYYGFLLSVKGLLAKEERVSDEELAQDKELSKMAILLPTYKEPFSVSKMTLDSVINQDYPGERVIVVVDNSFEPDQIVEKFEGEAVTEQQKAKKKNYEDWLEYLKWKQYVESMNGQNGVKTVFIARKPEPKVKPVNIDLGIQWVFENHPDVGFFTLVDADSTLGKKAMHTAAHELNKDENLGFVQMYTLSTNGALGKFADKVAITLSGQRLGTGFNSMGGFTLCYGHNVVFSAKIAKLLKFMDHDDQGRPMITEDFKVAIETYLQGSYGKTVWVNSGEWVPFSPEGLDGMWRRWAFGGLQTAAKLSKKIKETIHMSLVEKDNLKQFIRWYYFQTLIPILSIASLYLPIPKGWVQMLIMVPILSLAAYMKKVHSFVPGGERWQVWKYLVLVFIVSAFGQIFFDSNINNWIFGVSGFMTVLVSGRVLWASMIASTLITWSVFVATIKFMLGMKEGWKVTNKGAEKQKTWKEFIQAYSFQLSFIVLSLIAWTYRVRSDIQVLDFTQKEIWKNLMGIMLDTSPTLMFMVPLFISILIYGRARLKENTDTTGADIQGVLERRRENMQSGWWKRFLGARKNDETGNKGEDSAMITKLPIDPATPVGGITMDSNLLDLKREGNLQPVNFTIQPDEIPKFNGLFHKILDIRIVTPVQLLSRVGEESEDDADSGDSSMQAAAVLRSRDF